MAVTRKSRPRPRQRGKAHSDDTKARVIAALLLGAGVMEVAREFGLPHRTVSNYKAEIPDDKLAEVGRKKGERIEELVVDYLTMSLVMLRKQAEFASTEEFLQKQSADGLHLLHGTIADKAIRILEAIHRSGESDRPQLSD